MVNRSARKIVRFVVLAALLIVMVFPLLWMFRMAFADSQGSVSFASVLDGGWTFGNFVDLFAADRIGWYVFNSFIVAIVVTAGNCLFCFMVAYALTRYRLIVNRLLFVTVLITVMIPAHIVIIPMYVLMVRTGLYDSYAALILPWLVNPIGIFLVKQYLESLPVSMEEAARLEGAGDLRIIFRLVMPICTPALAVLAIQVFFTNWNSFLFPFLLTQSESLRTLPVALALYQGHQAVDWPHLMAGSTIAVVPVLALFIFLQKRIVAGMTAGSLKQ